MLLRMFLLSHTTSSSPTSLSVRSSNTTFSSHTNTSSHALLLFSRRYRAARRSRSTIQPSQSHLRRLRFIRTTLQCPTLPLRRRQALQVRLRSLRRQLFSLSCQPRLGSRSIEKCSAAWRQNGDVIDGGNVSMSVDGGILAAM